MVENISKPVDYVTTPELEEGIKNGSLTTFTIEKRNLPFYQSAAIKTGFEVEKIAEPGQHYITEQTTAPIGHSTARRSKQNTNPENKTPIITAVRSQSPVRESYVAISLKRPKDVKYDTAFHIARQKIQPI